MDPRVVLHVAITLVCVYVVDTSSRVTLVSFPVNVTSWKKHLQDKLSHPVSDLREKLNQYVSTVNNGGFKCIEEGGEVRTILFTRFNYLYTGHFSVPL